MKLTTPQAALAFFALLLLTVYATARGEEAAGVYFKHGDWEVVCDNTLTCRMAGYCPEYPNERTLPGCGSVLITRAAGPNALLEGEVTLADYNDKRKTPSALTLRINGQSKGRLPEYPGGGHYVLAPAQIRALLAAARRDDAIEFVGDTKSFTLSGKGIFAALLQADKAQGRIGTPGALIGEGDKPEESVFPPRPKPVIRAAKVSDALPHNLTAPEIAALKPLLLQNKKVQEDCDTAHNKFTLTPLNEQHVLISMLCWRAAYNEGYAYWVMDSTLEGAPKFVTTAADGYDRGKLFGVYRDRGPADCQSGSFWIWDGQEFRLSETLTTGDCRSIHLGGTWHLPTFITNIVNADRTPRAPD